MCTHQFLFFTDSVPYLRLFQIIELSKNTCEKASQLLTHVNQLVGEEGVSGDGGVLLDERGAALVDVVQALLIAAQVQVIQGRNWREKHIV